MRTTTTTSAIADSVAALLKQAREESGLSRAAVAVRSKIPERYIALFEEDVSGQSMPEDVYAKIYLKAYGKFLGFDATTLVDLYKKEKARTAPAPERRAPARSSSSSARRHPTKSIPTSQMVVTPKIIQSAMLGLAVVGFAVYFGIQIKKIIAPPEIALVTPQDGLVTDDRSLLIEGRTDAEVLLHINGKQVSPDADGKFKDTLDLQEGLNIITVTGAKKHSKEMSVTRRIIVMPKERAAVAVPTDATTSDLTPTDTAIQNDVPAAVSARKKYVAPTAAASEPTVPVTEPATVPTATAPTTTPAATPEPAPATP